MRTDVSLPSLQAAAAAFFHWQAAGRANAQTPVPKINLVNGCWGLSDRPANRELCDGSQAPAKYFITQNYKQPDGTPIVLNVDSTDQRGRVRLGLESTGIKKIVSGGFGQSGGGGGHSSAPGPHVVGGGAVILPSPPSGDDEGSGRGGGGGARGGGSGRGGGGSTGGGSSGG